MLDKPLALLTPQTIGDNDEDSLQLLDSCRRLASQTSFQLHVDLTGKNITVGLLQQLCTAACGAGLSSSEPHANIKNLYHGEGGRLVEGETLELPPLYTAPAGPDAAVTAGSCECCLGC